MLADFCSSLVHLYRIVPTVHCHVIFKAASMQSTILCDENRQETVTNNSRASRKRLAVSPATGDMKRSAFGDITNAVIGKDNGNAKVAKCLKPARKSLRYLKKLEKKEVKSSTTTGVKSEISQNEKGDATRPLPETTKKLYPPPGSLQNRLEKLLIAEEQAQTISTVQEKSPCGYYAIELSPRRRKLKYFDHDAENVGNPYESPVYALAIFEYMRARQNIFPISKYMSSQKEVTADMRAVLVDWMVEVQENFELNHETLYLAVKLVDLFLQEMVISKDTLQLIGAAAIFIAAKFDERHPPGVDDFMYICDDAYNRNQMLAMERSLLHTVGFDINIPISYRFLRRYAKCSKTNMQTLTLARFVLELSLQCYDLIDQKDSLMAASALWLAFKMKRNGEWNETLLYYTSHTEKEVLSLAKRLSAMVDESKDKKLQTIWQKYSHKIFYEVAKTPLLNEQQWTEEEERIENEAVLENLQVCNKLQK